MKITREQIREVAKTLIDFLNTSHISSVRDLERYIGVYPMPKEKK